MIDNRVVGVFVCDLSSCLEMHKICFVSQMIDGKSEPFPRLLTNSHLATGPVTKTTWKIT